MKRYYDVYVVQRDQEGNELHAEFCRGHTVPSEAQITASNYERSLVTKDDGKVKWSVEVRVSDE